MKTSTAWAISIGVALICLVGVVARVRQSYTDVANTRLGHAALTTQAEVEEFKAEYDRYALAAGWGRPTYVPTGVFIQSLEFTSSYNVRASGYIWQRYPKPMPDGWRQGVSLPEAETQNLTEAYRIDQGDEELVGWYFTAIMRLPFDYRRYPFDRQDVRFRIWLADWQANSMTVPDLAAYANMAPESTPGLEEAFVLEGWDLVESYFSYRTAQYNSNFGYQDLSGIAAYSELYFNVGIQREVVTPLLTQGVSPAVVFMLVFVTFLFFSTDRERRGVLGLNWNGMIGLLSGSFFATLIAQAGLRNQIRSDGFVYLESLHILLYPTILCVATVTTLVVTLPHVRLFSYGDNLIARLLYWPLVTAALLLVTVILF